VDKILFSVGPNQLNMVPDVRLVQVLLNRALKLTPKLVTDGKFGQKTFKAIHTFQTVTFDLLEKDNIITPTSETFKRLQIESTKAKAEPNFPVHVTNFISMALPFARKVKKDWKVPIGALISQSAQETGWGQHVKGNAYFGIKGKSPSGASTTFTTHEVVDGKNIKIDDAFRAYKDFGESADDYGRFLNSNPRYSGCFLYPNDPEKFVVVLAAAGYATDPSYATNLTKIIRKYGLASYDLPK